MEMYDPCHPGEIVLHECIEALGLSVAEAAAHLQVEAAALQAVCEERAPITADLAIRLELAFGSTASHWLAMQNSYDLFQAKQQPYEIARIEPAA